MSIRHLWPRVAVLAGALAVAALAPATALANTVTGNQNPQLLVTSSLMPNQATTGQHVTASGSVHNTTSHTLTVKITITLILPNGQQSSRHLTRTLSGGQTVMQSQTVTVSAAAPRGVYKLKVVARDAQGASHATSHTTIT